MTAAREAKVRERRGHRMTLGEIRKQAATVDVETAAAALGVGRSTLYEAIRTGQSPVRTITVGRRILVLTADLIRVVGGDGDGA